MSNETDNKMEVDGEGEVASSSGNSQESFKDKYRQLKSKLKYLVCVSAYLSLKMRTYKCTYMCVCVYMEQAVCISLKIRNDALIFFAGTRMF